MITIRPFTPADYEPVVALGNACFPHHVGTVSEAKFGDAHRDPKCLWGRFVGEIEGRIVASGDYGQWSGGYHPQKFFVTVNVHPDSRRRGYGGAMYDHVLEQIAPFDPILLRVFVHEESKDSLAFVARRDYVEDLREWESHLDVATFDFAPFADDSAKFAASGITIKTERELESDPDRDRKLYDLVMTLLIDVPSPEPFTPEPFEQWANRFKSPNYDGASRFVALDGDRYVGVSMLSRRQGDEHLHTGLTGVRREYRRRGIALGLKLRAVEYAVSVGAPVIRTENEINNRGMLAINERLGFVRQPAWLLFAKKLKD